MIKNWNKEFDKEFVDGVGWSDKHIYRDGGELHIKRVKQFIKSLINKKLDSVKLEKVNPDFHNEDVHISGTPEYYETHASRQHDHGYNQAVNEFNKRIDEEKVE